MKKFLVGSSSGDEPLADLETRLGFTLDAFRDYSQTWPDTAHIQATLSADKAKDRASLYSVKPPAGPTVTARWQALIDAVQGKLPAVQSQLMAICTAIIASGQKTVFFTVHHEPNGDGGSPAKFVEMTNTVAAFMHRQLDLYVPEFYYTVCPTAWLWLNNNPGPESPATYLPSSLAVDVVAVDGYGSLPDSNGKPVYTRSFEATFTPIVAWARANKRKLYVWETGEMHMDQGAWLLDAWAYIKKNLDVFVGLTWWSSRAFVLSNSGVRAMRIIKNEADALDVSPEVQALRAQVASLTEERDHYKAVLATIGGLASGA